MRRVACQFWLLFFLPFLGCRPAAGTPAGTSAENQERRLDLAASNFFAGPILPFEVRIAPKDFESLRQEARKAVPARVTVGTNVFDSVTVHVKGAVGSSRSIEDRPALTLNFGKLKAGQTCFGLHKLHLNNSVQDESRLNELIGSTLYRRAGVPTARTTHALVQLNGRDLGLYVLKEGYDKAFVRRNFPQGTHEPGNLYDGGFVRDIEQDLVRDVGPGTNNYADLKLLRAAVDAPVTTRAAKLGAILDVDRFITFCAIQSLTEDWDGYARNHNNYRLYHDPVSGRFNFIPHGMDQLFGNSGHPIEPGWNGIVAQRLFELPEYRSQFLDRVALLSTNLFTAETITNLISATEAKLRVALAGPHHDGANHQLQLTDRKRRSVLERIKNITQQVSMRPKPLRFDEHGETAVGGWQPRPDTGNGVAEVVTLPPVGQALHLVARSAGTVAGFRAPLHLPAGHYTLAARIRTSHLTPLKDARGEGAGLRISGGNRSNTLAGTADWALVRHDFDLSAGRDLELVAEIRANSGEAWFDLGSMKIIRRLP